MLKQRNIVIVVLVVYTLIIFLPPLIYSYVYPNNGDDTAFHLRYFDAIKNGQNTTVQYLGQNIIGYPLVWVSNTTGVSIDALFLWFNFLMLWLVGIMAFVLITKFVDWKAGLLAIPMVIFMTPSTLNLYDTGAIYDLMTVGVILPMVLYCGVKLWTTKKWYWVFPLLITVALTVGVHTMVLWYGIRSATVERQIPTLSEFASIFLGFSIILLFFVAVFWCFQSKSVKIERQAKVLIICLVAIILLMCVLVFTGFVGWSLRIALDVSIVFPLLVACLLGVVLKNNRGKLAWGLALGIVCLFVVVASLPITISYMHYNSAIKPLDMKAIEYMNSLSGEYYSCSPEVAPWVYERFLNKEYRVGASPHIARKEPMTSRTKPESCGYWWGHGAVGYWQASKVDYVKPDGEVVKFYDGTLEIEVVH